MYQGCCAASGSRESGVVFDHGLDAGAHHHFARGDAAAAALDGDVEQFDAGLRRGHAGKGGLHRTRPRHHPQYRGGNDAQRAFRPDEQIFQVVTGIVLLQLVEVVEHAAVGEHDLESERVRAGNTVGNGRDPAGVGREIAADGAGALRRQQLRIEPVGVRRRFTRALQRHAGFHRHSVGDRVHVPYFVEPRQRQYDFAVVRDLSADQPGVAALRHDCRLSFVGELCDGCNLRQRTRP